MRIDQLLVQQGLAASRSQAARLVAAGVAWRLTPAAPWRTATKAGDEVPELAELRLSDDRESRYVSRGGLKLEGALAATGVPVRDRLCLDVGQSTGGFTDCLLHHGARHVVGVDVGHGQLHPRLRSHPQVTALERVNARELNASVFVATSGRWMGDEALKGFQDHPRFDLVVGDVSFISLTLVLPAVVPWLAAGGDLLMLVKPQFELQPQDIGKGGLVRDPALHAQVEQRLRQCCQDLNLTVVHWCASPIEGGDGNREFFVHARHSGGCA